MIGKQGPMGDTPATPAKTYSAADLVALLDELAQLKAETTQQAGALRSSGRRIDDLTRTLSSVSQQLTTVSRDANVLGSELAHSVAVNDLLRKKLAKKRKRAAKKKPKGRRAAKR